MSIPRTREFIAGLQALAARDDRAALADLRHGVSPGTSHRAWPHLAHYCDLRKEDHRLAFAVVGAGFATHGATRSGCGNLGTTLRRLALGAQGRTDDALASFAGRFRRLLTCATTADLCHHLPGILRAAERKGVQVDYELLLRDLLNWEQDPDTKIRWAEAYWGATGAAATEGGDA